MCPTIFAAFESIGFRCAKEEVDGEKGGDGDCKAVSNESGPNSQSASTCEREVLTDDRCHLRSHRELGVHLSQASEAAKTAFSSSCPCKDSMDATHKGRVDSNNEFESIPAKEDGPKAREKWQSPVLLQSCQLRATNTLHTHSLDALRAKPP